MVKGALPGVSDEEVLGGWDRRKQQDDAKRSHRESFKSIASMAPDLTKDEAKLLKTTAEDLDGDDEGRKDFRTAWREKRRQIREAAAGRRGKGRGRGRGGRAEVDEFARFRQLRPLLEVEADQATLARYCPPGGHIWNNWRGSAWGGHMPPNTRTSCPWACGHLASAIVVIRTLWEYYLLDNGLEQSACPINGLFD